MSQKAFSLYLLFLVYCSAKAQSMPKTNHSIWWQSDSPGRRGALLTGRCWGVAESNSCSCCGSYAKDNWYYGIVFCCSSKCMIHKCWFPRQISTSCLFVTCRSFKRITVVFYMCVFFFANFTRMVICSYVLWYFSLQSYLCAHLSYWS